MWRLDDSIDTSQLLAEAVKTALVTGGAKRIGAAICRALDTAGYAVIIHCNSSAIEAGNLASELNHSSVIQADLSTSSGQEELVAKTITNELVLLDGGLDLIVHNASVYRKISFKDIDRESLALNNALHLEAPLFITQGLSDCLKEKNGCVIGILDTSEGRAWQGLTHYTSTKAAKRQLLLNMASELAPEIRVNAVAPGVILAAEWEEVDKLVERVPLKRQGNPEDVANAVVFLAQAEYITGQVLAVDGGWSFT